MIEALRTSILVPHDHLHINHVSADGQVIARPVREREETLVADLDLGEARSARRHLDPVGHYHRPGIFRLHVEIVAPAGDRNSRTGK